MTVLDILKKVPLFESFSENELEKIKTLLRNRSFKSGDHIFSESEAGEEFYIVSGGRVKIYKMSPCGQVKTLEYLEKGDFFGEMALLDRCSRSANAVASSDSELFSVSFTDFQRLLSGMPDMLLRITRTLCARLRKADREIELLSFSGVRERLVLCLINLAEKYGADTPRGILLPSDFTHQDLSELAGTAREVVTRIIKELKDEGVIISEGRSIFVPSLPDLRKKIIL